jgi:hypothetical protein
MTCERHQCIVHTRCLYQNCPIPLSSRKAHSTCTKWSFANLLPSTAEGKNEPWGCCASAYSPFDTHSTSSSCQIGSKKTHNYPHWNNCFKVCNPGLVLCIGRNKVWRQRMQKFSLTEWAHRYQVTSKMTWKRGNGKCTFACCFIWMAASFIFEIADIRGLADTPGALHWASCVCTPIASDYIDHMVNNWIQNNWVMFISIHMPLLLWTLGLQRTVGTKTQQVCVVSFCRWLHQNYLQVCCICYIV